jgi:DNA-binding transcriptional ArsR family regulator
MVDAADDAFQSDFCAERLKALGDPLRLRVVDLLRHGEITVGDIAEFLETEMVNVSHHLQILKNAKLVTTRRDGRFIYYSLPKELFQNVGKAKRMLNLGCCKLELP